MFLIFNAEKVFRLCVPNETIRDEMIKDGESSIEVAEFQTPKMPKLSQAEDGADMIEWISRSEFELIRNPPSSSS